MKKLISAQDILNAANNNIVKKIVELSTLEENDDYPSTIHVDCVIEASFGVVNFTSIVNLEENEDGQLECIGIDQNTENTCILIVPNGFNDEFSFEGESYTADDLAQSHAFHTLLLNTNISSLTADEVNKMLKQILVCDRVAA